MKQRPDELEKLVEIAKIQSTEASNAIEGIITTNARIKQLVEEKTTPRNRDEQEIAGYRDVLGIIHESYDAIEPSVNHILQLHKILYSHMNNPMAGRTKSVQNYISATYPDGRTEILFTPLAPYETREALQRICEELNRVIGNMELEPLIAIPVTSNTPNHMPFRRFLIISDFPGSSRECEDARMQIALQWFLRVYTRETVCHG